MKHLTTSEIIDFVSMDELNEKNINLTSKVNAHILQCNDCLEKVKAYQILNKEFKDLRIKKFEESYNQILEESDYNI